MGNCILCVDKPKVYVPMPEDEIYKSPNNVFITSFGTIPEIVPPSPFTSSKEESLR
jgi:hypothetical protein